MLIVLSLSDPHSGIKVVGQGWIQNFVAMALEVGRLQTARSRLPAVEEEDLHFAGVFGFSNSSLLASGVSSDLLGLSGASSSVIVGTPS